MLSYLPFYLTPFHRVYGPQAKFLKSEYFYNDLGVSSSLLTLTDPHKHKTRRAIYNPAFSKKSVSALESVMQDKLEKAIQIMKRHHIEGKPFDIQRLYRCILVRL